MPKNRIKNERLLQSFGATLKEQRRQIGLTQQELADRAAVMRTYVADVERGSRNVSLGSLVRLVSACELSLAKFFAVVEATKMPRRRAKK